MNSSAKIILTIISLLWAFSANAETISRNVSAGKTTAIYAYAVSSSSNCKDATQIRLGKSHAKHGKIFSQIERMEGNVGRCKGVPMKATVIYYTPDPGFRGTDSFRFVLTWDKYIGEFGPTRSHSVRAKVTVK